MQDLMLVIEIDVAIVLSMQFLIIIVAKSMVMVI